MDQVAPRRVPLPPPKPLPTGWDQVGGVIADMMTLMAATAKRPQPVLALGASLCAIGALMGRKYRTESNTRSNLYVVGIAESGAGKNHSRVVINELFRKAGLAAIPGRQQDRIRLGPLDRHPASARHSFSAR
jgi:hypothetical protein